MIKFEDQQFCENYQRIYTFAHANEWKSIHILVSVTAPLYFWDGFELFERITNREIHMERGSLLQYLLNRQLIFSKDDFSIDSLTDTGQLTVNIAIDSLNWYSKEYYRTYDDDYLLNIIGILPYSYNVTRKVMLDYETLAELYETWETSKIREFREFTKWIETLPYSKWICHAEEE